MDYQKLNPQDEVSNHSTSHMPTVRSRGKGHLVPLEQSGMKRRKNVLEYYLSKSSFGSVFGPSSTTVSVELAPTLDTIEDLVLECKIKNGSTSAAQYLESFFFLDHVEILTNGGLTEYWDRDSLRDAFFRGVAPTEELNKTYASVVNYDVDTLQSSGTSFGAGTTNTFHIPLRMCWVCNPGICWSGITDRVTFKFYFKPGADIFTSASVASDSQSLEDLRLYALGSVYDPSVRQSIVQRMKQSTHTFRANFPLVQISQLGTITSGNNITQILNQINGDVSSISFQIRDSNAKDEALSTFSKIQDLDLRDASNRPEWVVDVDQDIYRRFVAPKIEPESYLSSQQSQISVPFCESTYDILNKKTKNGCFTFTAQETVHLTPGVSGAKELLVISYEYASVSITPNGNIVYKRL